jgi:integrase/recombinase XerC
MRLDRAIDLFQGEQARKGRSPRTRDDYFRKLVLLCPKEGECPSVGEVTADDCRKVLDRWRDSAPGTRYHSWAVLSSFFGWLYRAGVIEVNPMARVEAPRRHSDDLDVTTVSANDVRRLFDACERWHDLLCLATLAYLGPRRRAASNLRRRDLDLDAGTARFREKGGKVITKPLPQEFAQLLGYAIQAGVIGAEPDAYVIPMIREQRRSGNRDARIIWRTVKQLAKRAGIEATPHAIRGAFAVHFLEGHPGELEALQRLMGHSKISTTEIYLRRLDRARAMERVRDLSWGLQFEALEEEAPTRIELVCEALQASA